MNIALIVAAGSGLRALSNCSDITDHEKSLSNIEVSHESSQIPKQYQCIAFNRMILTETISKFLSVESIDFIQVVINSEHIALYQKAIEQLFLEFTEVSTKKSSNSQQKVRNSNDENIYYRLLPPCIGGDIRQASVYKGLQAIEKFAPDNVLIHDGARPFIHKSIIDRMIVLLEKYIFENNLYNKNQNKVSEKTVEIEKIIGVDLNIPMVDSLRYSNSIGNSKNDVDLDRGNLYCVQTPQVFCYKAIMALHKLAIKDSFICNDDIALCVKYKRPYTVMIGDNSNYKITTSYDIKRARFDYAQSK